MSGLRAFARVTIPSLAFIAKYCVNRESLPIEYLKTSYKQINMSNQSEVLVNSDTKVSRGDAPNIWL